MKEKYQEWADAARRACEQRSLDQMMRDREINNQVADFLQSLADMPGDEPDESMTVIPPKFGLKNGVPYVTKANRDWWIMHCGQFKNERDAAIKELAAANARIESLQKIIRMQNGESVTLTEPLDVRDFGAIADQPKRPILADQPMTHDQLDCILDLIRAAVDEPTNYRRWNDCVVSATKLLVGE